MIEAAIDALCRTRESPPQVDGLSAENVLSCQEKEERGFCAHYISLPLFKDNLDFFSCERMVECLITALIMSDRGPVDVQKNRNHARIDCGGLAILKGTNGHPFSYLRDSNL